MTLKKAELAKMKAATLKLGVAHTASKLGIHSSVLMRLMAGLPVRLGSIELARSRLPSLTTQVDAPERAAS